MSDSTHIWYSVRSADGKADFDAREDAEGYAAKVEGDWNLVKVEVHTWSEDPSDVDVRAWVIGGSATLAAAVDTERPLTMRSGD